MTEDSGGFNSLQQNSSTVRENDVQMTEESTENEELEVILMRITC